MDFLIFPFPPLEKPGDLHEGQVCDNVSPRMLGSFVFFPIGFCSQKGGLSPNEHDLSVWPVFIHGKSIYEYSLNNILYIYILYVYTDLLLKVLVELSNQVKNRKNETIVASSQLAETEALMTESV